MNEKKGIGRLFLFYSVMAFAPSILVMALSGWIISRVADDSFYKLTEFSLLGSDGMSYQSIAQIFLLSLIFGALLTIFMSEIFFKKVMLLWRYMIFIFLSSVTLCLFAIIFQWFRIDMREAYLTMALLFIVFFTIGIIPVIIRTKLNDKRYKKLLSEYKSKNIDD